MAVGSHTFNVKASDGNGNTDATPASFTWTVVNDVTSQQKTQNIIDKIQDLVNKGVLNKGQGNSFIVKLDVATKSIKAGDNNTAKNQFKAFINEANAYIKSKGLSAQLQPLIDQANGIITQLG